MRVLNAYTNAGAAGRGRYDSSPKNVVAQPAAEKQKAKEKARGDSLTLSDEALELLESGKEAKSFCPQDATYDQFGNVTRQFDDLQNDLRRLAGTFMSSPENAGAVGKIAAMSSQLANLQATV